MKLTKSELKQKISERISENDDLVIELLEDIEDSMLEGDNPVNTELQETNARLISENETLKTKYKERFLQEVNEVLEDVIDDSSMGEVEIIDVKEI